MTPIVHKNKSYSILQRLLLAAVLCFWIVLILQCGNAPQEVAVTLPDSVILARIGNRVITKDDFLRRSEYTLRPVYCSGTSYIDKKIILNSLIAEKLIAMTTDADSSVINNRYVSHYIRGRCEQAMRQWLANVEGYDKARPDTSALLQMR